ncbi:MAG: hypothetical protein H0X73_01060 [Chthoniobacterales bacterium]|nr:hypothetical protein [Chthoniobacterales bacterium]
MPKPSISLIRLGASPEETTIAFRCEPESLDGSFSWGAVAEIQPRARGFMARNLTLENLTPDHNRTQGACGEVVCR